MRPYQNPSFVINPKAGGGRIVKDWPYLRARLESVLGPIHALFTRHGGHAQELTRHMLRGDADLIVAIGGDGTLNEVVNGLILNDKLIREGTHFAYVPYGTGGDFQRMLRMPNDFREIADVLASRRVVSVDVGRADLHNHRGYPIERYFLNMVSFGMGGEVAVRAKSAPFRWLGGKPAFFAATLWTALRYRGRIVQVSIDGGEPGDETTITNYAIGNGRYHGGGMHPCPQAVMTDGVLELTEIRYLSLPALIRGMRVLYSDNVYKHKKVSHARAPVVEAQAFSETSVEVDGEAIGVLPLRVGLMPRILPLVVPEGSLIQEPSAES